MLIVVKEKEAVQPVQGVLECRRGRTQAWEDAEVGGCRRRETEMCESEAVLELLEDAGVEGQRCASRKQC